MCRLVSQILQLSDPARRRAAAALGDSKAQGTARSPAPCLASASRARSLPLALPLSPSPPASQPAGARPPAPPPPCCRPPTSREQETRGPAEGDQVGEACWGREDPCSPAAVYLTAAADASDALWSQPAPRSPRLGVI